MKLSKPQQTLWVILAGMVLLYFIFKWKGFIFIGATICISGFLIPALGDIIHKAWMKLAHILGYINSRILLTFIFFLALTPVSFFSKIFRKSSMKTKAGSGNSLYHTRHHLYEKKDLENTW